MKKLTVLATSLLCLYAGWCLGEAKEHRIGSGFWKAFSPMEREVYLDGFVGGYRQGGLQAGSMAVEKLAPGKIDSFSAADKNDYEKSLWWAHKVFPVLNTPLSISSFQSTVTAFYGDYRNMTVCLDDAVLFSAASMGGNAASEQELAAARKRGVERGCK